MKKSFFILFISLFICSCDKQSVNTPDFDVSTPSLTYKVGDAINFTFSGNPNTITFYSGEPGFRYSAISRLVVAGKPNALFTSYASTVGTQVNSLKFLVSTDFSGTYDAANIAMATWTDLTSRATLSSGTDNTSSGTIDLSDIVTNGKPVYFAFKKHDDNDPVKTPWSWIIRSFTINLLASDDNLTYPITTLSTAGWLSIDVLNPTYTWVVSSTALTAAGGPINTAENEDWVVSNPISLYTVKPDVGVALKGIDTRLSSYSYIFKTAGVYTVSFVGANTNQLGSEKVVRQLTITVN